MRRVARGRIIPPVGAERGRDDIGDVGALVGAAQSSSPKKASKNFLIEKSGRNRRAIRAVQTDPPEHYMYVPAPPSLGYMYNMA